MGFSIVSTEARTGEIIADLPLLSLHSVKQTIGRYETVSVELPVDLEHAPADWERATKPNAVHIVVLADNPNDPTHGIPLIGYRISRRIRDHTNTVKLDLQTIEGSLDRVYVKGKDYVDVGQNDIIADLVQSYLSTAAGGIPVRVEYATAGAGKLRKREYLDQDDKTVYSIMQDLMGIIEGPEWTTGWEWRSNPERLTLVVYVGDRVGSAATAGLAPAVTFEMPGPVSSFELIEDFGVGRGATDVMATSSGEGDIRPQSSHFVTVDPDMPTAEHRYSPGTSITAIATLDDYAQRASATLAHGSHALALTADVGSAPQLNVDWFLGDDAGYSIGMPNTAGRDTVPAFPGGREGIARIASWELTLGPTPQVTPILISPSGDFDG